MQQPSLSLALALPPELTEAIQQYRADQTYGDIRIAFERGVIVLVEKRSTHKVAKVKVDAVPTT